MAERTALQESATRSADLDLKPNVTRLPGKADAPPPTQLRETQAPPSVAPATPDATVEPPPRRGWKRPVLFALLPLALVAGGYVYVTGGQLMSTENAYIRADMVGVSTDISGIVKTIDVRENQSVVVGDVLFRIDDLPFRLALTRADAQVGIVATELNAMKTSYHDMQAQIAQAQADVDYYTHDVQRQRQLIANNIASQVTFEQAQRNLQGSQQKVASLNQQLAGIQANLAGDPDIAVEKHPRYISAVAQRDEAARQLSHTTVLAPMAGIVTNVPTLQPGQYLAASAAAFSIVASDHMWIDANPKETELTYVRPGQPVTIAVDTYPADTWSGVVDSISPASSGSFSLLPAQNTSGNWVKVVQRIPMRVRIDTPADKPPLRAGMSVVIDVDTGHARGWPPFLAGLFGHAETPRG